MMKKLIPILMLGALAYSAQASVTMTFQAAMLRNSGGSAITNGSKVGILLDSNGDNTFLSSTAIFDGRTLGSSDVGSTYGGDTLIGVFNAVDLGGGAFGINGDISGTFTEGVDLAIVWLSGYTNSSNPIAAGQEYGLYQNTQADPWSGGDQGLITPTDGFNYLIAYFDQSFTGNGSSASVSDFSANYTVTPAVPEPASAALFGLGSVALLLRRRR